MLWMCLFLLLCWPARAETETVLTLDGIVCGSRFLDPAVNHPVGGEFNRSPGSDGRTRYDDLNEVTHVETDREERIIAVRGATLSLNGQALARLGETEAQVLERCKRSGWAFNQELSSPPPGGRAVSEIVPTRYGRVGVRLGFSDGKLDELHLALQPSEGLWKVYDDSLRRARYVDLTHVIAPGIPVWKGFGPSEFGPAIDPATRKPYTYAESGFEATRYQLAPDQLGTQLDPPAHWDAYYPAIDELPPTFAVRPLVVISIVDKVRQNPGYHLSVDDVKAWEKQHGPIPAGSVVFVRSDWSKRWNEPGLAANPVFPGVGLDALRYLHLERKILMHGHEPLDTDTTPTLEGEAWLLHNGYTQAEGVANLDQVPETGALVAIGFPRFQGGTGGYARYIAICPPDWAFGVTIEEAKDAPLEKRQKPLRWENGVRVR